MWSPPGHTQDVMQKSELACHSCRKRKVKCDREFPQCLVCEQTGQTCNYPMRPMRPGPKIGSLHRQKRRCRDRHSKRTEQQRQAESPSGSPEDAEVNHEDQEGDTPNAQCKEPMSFISNEDRNDERSPRRQNSQFNIHDLSFILHPSHEASTPEKDQSSSPAAKDRGWQDMCQQACHMLGVSQKVMDRMIRVYFDNMVAINLFHELSFPEKLGGITSLSQLCALLAAITGYAARFYPSDVNSTVGDELRFMDANYPRPAQFLRLAFKYIDEALMECDDETPPLCVVQALIIATHCQLTRGVHGKAWRSLGLCVRLAYEMNLHLVDSRGAVQAGQEDPIRWQADEEKRRAWWAIWEMDVFASTIRRTPTAMDWTQMEILLPIEDADWFRNHPVPSCFMEIDPVHRWKALQESGNQSPKAWYLVINSLMKGAQMISSPRGVPYLGNPDHYPPSNSRTRKGTNSVEDAQQKLETLANAVHCFVLAIPAHLRYRNQYLSFDPPLPGHCGSLRQQHCSTYNIFVMTQLARLMIHRYDVFGVHTPTRRPEGGSEQFTAGDGAGRNSFSFHDLESLPLRQYFDAADNILTIVNQSCEEHIRHINPFLSSTVWLASAVQLVRKHFCRSITNPGLIKSRFDVLYLTYKRCVSFWDTQTALQQNLESLEVQLEANDNNELDSRERRPRVTSNRAQEKGAKLPTWVQHTLRSDQTDHHESDVGAQSFKPPLQNQAKAPTRFLLDTPPASIIGDSVTTQDTVSEMQPPVGSGYVQQQQQRQSGMGTMSLFDFMHMPSSNKNQLSRPECLSPMAPSMISPLFLDSTTSRTVDMNDVQQDQDFEWRNFDLPSGIHDLLSGFSTY